MECDLRVPSRRLPQVELPPFRLAQTESGWHPGGPRGFAHQSFSGVSRSCSHYIGLVLCCKIQKTPGTTILAAPGVEVSLQTVVHATAGGSRLTEPLGTSSCRAKQPSVARATAFIATVASVTRPAKVLRV